MAEMDTSSGGGHKKGPGVKKSKKLSTRVDLTPMVDLGFLLITFFMFTTTMQQPTAMKLNLPDDKVPPDQLNKTKESSTLTIMLGKNNHVYYIEGILDPAGAGFKSSSFKDIRNEIITKKANSDPKDFMVIIMPGDSSNYKNVVNILDEMTINDVKRYALVNIDPMYAALVQKSDATAQQ
jgi:biopolymer transport protein ExbD